MDSHDLSRQVLTHLKQLRNAGIEWLPRSQQVAAVAVPAPPPTAEPQPPEAPGSEFEIASEQPAGLASGLTLDQRRLALQTLAGEVSGCTRCSELCSTRTQIVFGDGQPGVEICFVGEAPGADEDAQGVPFVGAAGQLLNKIISACGFQRGEVYICNILKCRPPGNRTPLPNEAANCRGFLDRQLELVAPKFIVCLGGCAATNLLNTNLAIGKLRGRFHDYKGIPTIATYHPAYLLPHRAPEKKREVWEDMKMLLARLGRPVPPPQQ